MIPKHLIATGVEVETWQDAVREVGYLLLENDLIELEYIHSMIETVNKHGPFMILVPEISLFHGKPGALVKESSISLITLKDTVYFSEFENQPIKVAFAFGGTDSDAHLSLLKEIAKLLLSEELKTMLISNASKEEIAEKINELS